MHKLILVLWGSLVLTLVAPAQTPAWRFRWQKGQDLNFRVEQTTSVTEMVKGKKTTFATKLNLVKRWQVQEVDEAGTATVQLSLAAMRNEITRPDGEVLLFDSANPEKNTPELSEQLKKYLSGPLAILCVDSRGKVVQVKESKHGPSSRYETELPFRLALPETAPAPGSDWTRNYQIVLDPPQGTGEKYDASQKFTCKTVENQKATISVTTTLAKLPENLRDQIPFLQLQPEGTITFDSRAGLVQSIRLKIDKELKEHQGEGSSYRFQSTYTEEYVEKKE
jgi:hypothetical protein